MGVPSSLRIECDRLSWAAGNGLATASERGQGSRIACVPSEYLRVPWLVTVFIFAGFLMFGGTVQAEMYFYRDASGKMVVVDDPSKIPAGQGNVQKREAESYPTPRPQVQQVGGAASPTPVAEKPPVTFTDLNAKITRNRRIDSAAFEGTIRNASGRKVKFAHLYCKFYDRMGELVTNDDAYLNPSDPEDGAISSFWMVVTDPKDAIVDQKCYVTGE